MKKQSKDRPRLVLKKHVIRMLATGELGLVAGAVVGNDSKSISGCPACDSP